MEVIIDRFEGEYAICEKENKTMINIHISKLPLEVKEGDMLRVSSDNITIDVEGTEKRKKEIEKITEDLWE